MKLMIHTASLIFSWIKDTHDLIKVLALLLIPPPKRFALLQRDIWQLGVAVYCSFSVHSFSTFLKETQLLSIPCDADHYISTRPR